MDRINTPTKQDNLFGAGKHGFRDGDNNAGIAPTDLDAAWFNGLQEEMMAIIEGAGGLPSAGVLTQVAQAIQSGNLSVPASGGTANAITLVFGPTATVFGKGPVWWRATAANTSTTPTVQRDGLAAKTLVKGANGALVNGDVPGAGAWMCSIYDPVLDKEVLINPAKGVTGSGGGFIGQLVIGAINDAPPNTMLADGSAVSRTTYAALFAVLVKSAVVTISLANPGVVSWVAHGRKANDPVKFTSTGILPTGYAAGTTYYVVGSSITPDTFTLSATPGGAAIATSGAPSGIHTAIYAPHGDGNGSTTFNLPDRRGEFIKGWDASRGVDANRSFGSWQQDAIRNITGTLTSTLSQPYYGISGTGAFTASNPGGTGVRAYTNEAGMLSVSFNASSVVPTASENRPRNYADAIFIVYQA